MLWRNFHFPLRLKPKDQDASKDSNNVSQMTTDKEVTYECQSLSRKQERSHLMHKMIKSVHFFDRIQSILSHFFKGMADYRKTPICVASLLCLYFYKFIVCIFI